MDQKNSWAAHDFSQEFRETAVVVDLPDAPRFGSVVGPGIILLATALGSGEILFWPSLAASHGFELYVLALFAFLCQYFLNLEFIRYTMATGDTVTNGFGRIWGGLSAFFFIGATLPWVWPGWVTGGATQLYELANVDINQASVIILVSIGVMLSSTRLLYKALELSQKLLIGFALSFSVILGLLLIEASAVDALGDSIFGGKVGIPQDISIVVLMAALAFCGAGGTINLAVSNWARDKGFGLAKNAPAIVNPITGQRQVSRSSIYLYAPTDDNHARWREWWRLVKKEETVCFLAAGIFGLTLFMLIAYSLLADTSLPPGFDVIREQANAISESHGRFWVLAFRSVVAAVFITSAIGVLDHSARLAASILFSTKYFSKVPAITESHLYFGLLWLLIAFGIFVVTVLDISSPPKLLSISGALSGIVMAAYSGLIILLNRRMRLVYSELGFQEPADNPFRISTVRALFLFGAVALYGSASIALMYSLFQ